MNVGLIGCGFMGHMHGEVYGALEGVNLVATCDIRIDQAEEVGAPHGARTVTDWTELLSDPSIDVIDCCLPTYLHEEITVAALDAGKHVVCEKPMALSTESAQRMIDARDRSGKTLMIAHCIRFWPEYRILKDVVDSGRLGSLLSLNLLRYGAFPHWSWEGWLANESLAGGGALDMHIHDTDYALYLLGLPATFSSSGTVDRRGVSHIFSTLDYDGGPVVHLEGGWNLPSSAPFKMAFRAIFERGMVNMDAGPLTIYEDGKSPEVPEVPKMAAAREGGNISDLGGYFFELEYFYRCLANGEPVTELTPESSLQSLDFNLQEIAQVKAGQTVNA